MKKAKGFWGGLKSVWCSYFHGGGYILRDQSGRVNWQCTKCGRWANPVSDSEEFNLLEISLKKYAEKTRPPQANDKRA